LRRQSTRKGTHAGRAWCVAWSPSGELLASCGEDRVVCVYAPQEDGKLVCLAKSPEHCFQRTVRSVAWSCDGRSLAAACFDATASILTLKGQSLVPVETLELHESEVKGVAYSASGTLLATCSRDKNAYVWESGLDNDFECIAILQGHTQDVKSVRWHPTKELLATTSYDDSVRLWREDYEDWYCCGKLTGHSSTVWSASFDCSGDRLATVSADKSLIVWRQGTASSSSMGADPTWRVVWREETPSHTRPIYTVDWRQHLIATGCGDNAIRIFRENNSDKFELVLTHQEAHCSDINCVSWHPSKQNLLASCGDDGDVHLWRLEEPNVEARQAPDPP